MTGGVVVVLGSTGHNFAAGMSGGAAYVYDPNAELGERCNFELVDLEDLTPDDHALLEQLVTEHVERTGSPLGTRLLAEWQHELRRFTKVMPRAYKKALAELASRAASPESTRVAATPLKVSA
jgi:glutamate synthase (NADPH/NADH) large chain